jgi:hypothetical protein
MNGDAPFAYSGLERIFHERGRLAVCTCLVANPNGMRFTELQEACALTDGNLNRHLHVTGRGRPATTVRITAEGRTRFLAYIDELESVVRDVHQRSGEGAAVRDGWAAQS